MRDSPTILEVNDWKTGYVTKEYISLIMKKIRDIEKNLGVGRSLTKDSADATLANTSYEIGKIKGLSDALGIIESINSKGGTGNAE